MFNKHLDKQSDKQKRVLWKKNYHITSGWTLLGGGSKIENISQSRHPRLKVLFFLFLGVIGHQDHSVIQEIFQFSLSAALD